MNRFKDISPVFGGRLAYFLKKSGIGKGEFGARFGRKPADITAAIRGRVPKGNELYEWAKILNVQMEDFFCEVRPRHFTLTEEEYARYAEFKKIPEAVLKYLLNPNKTGGTANEEDAGNQRGHRSSDLPSDRGDHSVIAAIRENASGGKNQRSKKKKRSA